MSSSSTSDPNGWVTNPPQTIVKVVNTSREDLNGKLGIVLQYTPRERYVVHMAVQQQPVSFKPENIAKATWMESMQAQYEFVTNDPRMRAQVLSFTQKCEAMTGLPLKYLVIGLGLLLVSSLYFLGMNKTFMTITMLTFMGVIILPDLIAGAAWPVIFSNIPMRVKAFIREQAPFGLGPRIASNNYYTMALVGSFFVIYLFTMIYTPSGRSQRTSSSPAVPSHTLPNAPPTTMYNANKATRDGMIKILKQQQELFYKMGYDDGKNNQESGTSIPDDLDLDAMNIVDSIYSKEKLQKRQLDDDENEDVVHSIESDEFYDEAPRGVTSPPADPSTSSSRSSWMNNIGTAGSVFYLYRTISDLAKDPITGQFNLQNVQTNFAQMDAWKMGLLGFVAYRLLAQLF